MFFLSPVTDKTEILSLSATGNQYLLWGITIQDFAL